METENKNKYRFRTAGFTLAEAMSALVIAAMIMIAAIGIYTGIKKAQVSINKRLEGGFLAMEVLQRIAEDIDRLAMPGSDVAMSLNNKIEAGGYRSAQMIIESKIYDKDNKPQVFEKIVWQSHSNPDANGLIVYRAHGGYSLEDTILDAPKQVYERERYVPVCSGVTLFSIEAIEDSNTNRKWEGQNLPPGVKVSISFAQPRLDVTGNPVIAYEDVKVRTIVVDRFKQPTYLFIPKEFMDANDINDINDINDVNDVNNPAEPNELFGESDRKIRTDE